MIFLPLKEFLNLDFFDIFLAVTLFIFSIIVLYFIFRNSFNNFFNFGFSLVILSHFVEVLDEFINDDSFGEFSFSTIARIVLIFGIFLLAFGLDKESDKLNLKIN